MQEVWKPVVGYEGLYEVSNLGRVKSLPRNGTSKNGRILSQSKTGKYLNVGLRNKGLKTYLVHILVAKAFLDYKPIKGLIVVDHIDNNGNNNMVTNLQVITSRENVSKDRIGTSKYTGVHWSNYHNKFIAQIKINKKQYHIGCFDCEIEAKNAYISRLNEINKNK